MRKMYWFAIWAVSSSLLVVPADAGTDTASVIAATYGGFSLSAPTPSLVTICHGFGCKHRVEVALSGGDRATLARLMAAGKTSAAGERRAVATAGAWFDRRIAPSAGTKGHMARAGYQHAFDAGQFDCIDASRNTTSLLLVLEQLHLLRHHDIEEPVARGYLIDGRPPHVTAVLSERGNGKKWAVDSWTRGYGQPFEIMPLSVWETVD